MTRQDDSVFADRRKLAEASVEGAARRAGVQSLAHEALNRRAWVRKAVDHIQANTCALSTVAAVRLPTQEWLVVAHAGQPLFGGVTVQDILTEAHMRDALTSDASAGPLLWISPVDVPGRAGWACSMMRDIDGTAFGAIFAKLSSQAVAPLSELTAIQQVSERLTRSIATRRRTSVFRRLRSLHRQLRRSRSLEDEVLQILFAAGLKLDLALSQLCDQELAAGDLLRRAISELDGIASEVRANLCTYDKQSQIVTAGLRSTPSTTRPPGSA